MAYDDLIHPTRGGDTGASGSYNGGAMIKIVVLDPTDSYLAPATINGIINMEGGFGHSACYDHKGGGGGGAILFEASEVVGSGGLYADGGSAGLCGGGHGGGGIISIIADTTAFTGTTDDPDQYYAKPPVLTITAPPTSGY